MDFLDSDVFVVSALGRFLDSYVGPVSTLTGPRAHRPAFSHGPMPSPPWVPRTDFVFSLSPRTPVVSPATRSSIEALLFFGAVSDSTNATRWSVSALEKERG
jgi:hypothetical protein